MHTRCCHTELVFPPDSTCLDTWIQENPFWDISSQDCLRLHRTGTGIERTVASRAINSWILLNSKTTQSLGKVCVIDELQRVVCSPLQMALLGKVDLFVFYGLFCGEEKSIKAFTFAFWMCQANQSGIKPRLYDFYFQRWASVSEIKLELKDYPGIFLSKYWSLKQGRLEKTWFPLPGACLPESQALSMARVLVIWGWEVRTARKCWEAVGAWRSSVLCTPPCLLFLSFSVFYHYLCLCLSHLYLCRLYGLSCSVSVCLISLSFLSPCISASLSVFLSLQFLFFLFVFL